MDHKPDRKSDGKDELQSVSKTEEDVFNLPSRKEIHKRPDRKRSGKRKKKTKIRFPLVRIWLVLFLLLVAIMVTYPVWSPQL